MIENNQNPPNQKPLADKLLVTWLVGKAASEPASIPRGQATINNS